MAKMCERFLQTDFPALVMDIGHWALVIRARDHGDTPNQRTFS